jgi:hypothetical protein
VARLALGKDGQQIEALAQLRHRLGQRPPGNRLTAGLEQIADRLLDEAGLGGVPRHVDQLGGGDFRKPAFQRGDDSRMELLAGAAQERAVGGVLHQRMLEGVLGVGRAAAPKDQLVADQQRQGVVELALRHRRDGADQLVGETAVLLDCKQRPAPGWLSLHN